MILSARQDKNSLTISNISLPVRSPRSDHAWPKQQKQRSIESSRREEKNAPGAVNSIPV